VPLGTASRWTYGYSAGYDVYLADADGDGLTDLASRYYGLYPDPDPVRGDVWVMRSTGAGFTWGGLAQRWSYGWGRTYTLLFRDVDGDGRADLVGHHTGTGDLYVGLSGATSFRSPTTWATGVDTAGDLH
jgi:hypothetical protein